MVAMQSWCWIKTLKNTNKEYLERYVRGGGQNSKSLAAKAVRERMDAAKKNGSRGRPGFMGLCCIGDDQT